MANIATRFRAGRFGSSRLHFPGVVAEGGPTGPLLVSAPVIGTADPRVGIEFTWTPPVFAPRGGGSVGVSLVIRPGATPDVPVTDRFTPRPEDDGLNLVLVVTATETGGTAAGTTGPLSYPVGMVRYLAPVLAGPLADREYTAGIAIPALATAPAFAGAALVYALAPASAPLPAGLSLSPATGVLSGTPASGQPAAGIIIRATNSGGSVDAAFSLAVVDLAVLTEPDGTLTIEAGRDSGPISITVTGPFAGTYLVDPLSFETGPVNLVAPVLIGSPSMLAGEVATVNPGLWVGRSSTALITTIRRSGTTIADVSATLAYTVVTADYGTTLTAAVSASNAEGSAAAVSAGLTIEGPATATNLIVASADLGHAAWVKSAQVSVTPDDAAAPDSTTTADRLTNIASGSSNQGISQDVAPVTSGQAYNLSVHVKYINNTWVQLQAEGVNSWFDVQNGVVGTVNAASAAITSLGGGWFRISVVQNAAGGTYSAKIRLANANGGTGAPLNGAAHLWGAQLTSGSSLQPYAGT